MRLIAAIEDSTLAWKILERLKLPARAPPLTPPTAPGRTAAPGRLPDSRIAASREVEVDSAIAWEMRMRGTAEMSPSNLLAFCASPGPSVCRKIINSPGDFRLGSASTETHPATLSYSLVGNGTRGTA